MKVKIFCSCDLCAVEKQVNEFIKNKCIINMFQSEIPFYDWDLKNHIPCLTITILYDDTFDCGYVKYNLEQEIFNNIKNSQMLKQ